MSHDTPCVARMQDPTEGLGKVVGRIDNSREVSHDNVASILPVLDGKVLDVNVTRSLSRNSSIDHFDRGHVVLVDRSGSMLWKSEFFQNEPQVPGMFSSENGGKKLSFGGAGSRDGLRLSAVRCYPSPAH